MIQNDSTMMNVWLHNSIISETMHWWFMGFPIGIKRDRLWESNTMLTELREQMS